MSKEPHFSLYYTKRGKKINNLTRYTTLGWALRGAYRLASWQNTDVTIADSVTGQNYIIKPTPTGNNHQPQRVSRKAISRQRS